MPRRKKSGDAAEPTLKKATVEEYEHGSLAKGDTPPMWVARAIEEQLDGNPYRDASTDELMALAQDLYRAGEQLALVRRVLQTRSVAW